MTIRIAAVALFGFVAGGTIGCAGDAPLENKTDSAAALNALETAMASWKRGDEPESLRSLQPPIIAIDDDWFKGQKLTKFEIGPGKPVGLGMQFTVALTFDGRPAVRKIKYRVQTDPVAISRDDS